MDADMRRAITAATQELSKKTLHEVQHQNALTWAGRACAAKVLGLPAEEAHEYAHEALEHAALTGDDDLLRLVRKVMASYGVEP